MTDTKIIMNIQQELNNRGKYLIKLVQNGDKDPIIAEIKEMIKTIGELHTYDLRKATDKEILEEVKKRRGVQTDKEWKLMLMDTETLNEIKKRMAFSKMTKTEIGKI